MRRWDSRNTPSLKVALSERLESLEEELGVLKEFQENAAAHTKRVRTSGIEKRSYGIRPFTVVGIRLAKFPSANYLHDRTSPTRKSIGLQALRSLPHFVQRWANIPPAPFRTPTRTSWFVSPENAALRSSESVAQCLPSIPIGWYICPNHTSGESRTAHSPLSAKISDERCHRMPPIPAPAAPRPGGGNRTVQGRTR